MESHHQTFLKGVGKETASNRAATIMFFLFVLSLIRSNHYTKKRSVLNVNIKSH